jgi:O-antigen ligase
VLAVVFSLLAGTSFLLVDSIWTPLIIGGAVTAVGIGVIWLKKPVLALYFAIFVITIPEGLLPSAANSIINRLSLVIALGLWLLSALLQGRQIVWTPATLIMFGFLVWSLITLFWAPYPNDGTEKIIQYTLRFVLFLILVINEIDSVKAVNGLMLVLSISSILLITFGFISILVQGYSPDTPLEILNVNRNSISEYLLITLPGILWLVMQVPRNRRQLFMFLSVLYVLVVLLLIVMTGSRGGLISIILTLLVFYIWKPTRSWGILGMIILILAVVSAPFIFSTVIRRFIEAEGGILGGRGPLWRAGFTLIMDHPLTGVGIGNATRTIIPYLGMLIDTRNLTERSLHNPILQIWADTGLIGLIFYLGVLISTVWSFFRQYFLSKAADASLGEPYFALIFGVFVGILATWIKGGGMEDAPTYFLILALMLIPSRLHSVTGDAQMEETPLMS